MSFSFKRKSQFNERQSDVFETEVIVYKQAT